MDKIIAELLQELSLFPGREEALRTIKRYSLYKTFFYRSSDYSHSKRVAWLIEDAAPAITERLGSNFDFKKALAIGLVHDDAEIVTGDYQAATKHNMSKEKLAELAAEERKAITELASRFPTTLGGYRYEDLMLEVLDLPTPESQVAKFLDRFDAQGEAWHELFAGNISVTERVTNEYGENLLPYEYYAIALPRMLESYEYMRKLQGCHVFFATPELRDWPAIVKDQRPHTRESLAVPTGHTQYDEWKNAVLTFGDSEEIKNLYTQQEFL